MTPPTVWLPIDRVMLCGNCDVTFEIGFRRCPACTSSQIISLARLINREEPV